MPNIDRRDTGQKLAEIDQSSIDELPTISRAQMHSPVVYCAQICDAKQISSSMAGTRQ